MAWNPNTQWWKTVLRVGAYCRTCGRRQVRGEVALFRADDKSVLCLACASDRGIVGAESRSYRRAVERAAERRAREAAI